MMAGSARRHLDVPLELVLRHETRVEDLDEIGEHEVRMRDRA